MKYNLNINQHQALELGITNINMAIIFDLLTSASTWATPEVVDGEVYYWVARQTIVNELKLLNLKSDTVYRHLKSLAEIGVIKYRKVGKKDCIRVTKKGKKYLTKESENTMSEIDPNYYVGNKSEKGQEFGNKSEKTRKYFRKNSDLNPTYHNTKDHNTSNNINKKNIKKDFLKILQDLQKELSDISLEESALVSEFLDYRKKIKHPIKTTAPLKSFVKELRCIREAGIETSKAVALMQEREWRTIKLDWVKNARGEEKQSGFNLGEKEYKLEEF